MRLGYTFVIALASLVAGFSAVTEAAESALTKSVTIESDAILGKPFDTDEHGSEEGGSDGTGCADPTEGVALRLDFCRQQVRLQPRLQRHM